MKRKHTTKQHNHVLTFLSGVLRSTLLDLVGNFTRDAIASCCYFRETDSCLQQILVWSE